MHISHQNNIDKFCMFPEPLEKSRNTGVFVMLGDRGEGAQENKGWEAGVLRGQESGQKYKMLILICHLLSVKYFQKKNPKCYLT